MSKSNRYRVFDDELFEHIDGLDPTEQAEWLVLSPHPRFAGRWYVDGISQGFFLDFEDLIGKYRTVSPASLAEFLDLAEELGYHVCFEEDPTTILSAWEHLNDPPAFRINSDMAEALEAQEQYRAAESIRQTGLLPFQVQGFNFLRRPELKSGLALWSTGTGKTALEAALIKQHMEVEKAFDLALVVVKSNNKIDTQKKLKQLGDIESFIIDGRPQQRAEQYLLFDEILAAGNPLVGITNYEKWRDDQEFFEPLVEGRRVLVLFDEMPMKLRNRKTQIYESVGQVLYHSFPKIIWDERRPAELRTYQLTATPIENSPLDQLNCIRLQDPDVFPTIRAWEKKYVATRDYFSHEPSTFKNLEEMGLELEFMTHQVDKEDPDIAAMFPKINPVIEYIDWHPKDRAVYDKLQDIAKQLIKEARKDPTVKKLNALSLIGVLQMICDAPSMVQKSAEKREEFEAVLAEAITDEEKAEAENILAGSEAALMLLQALKHDLTDDHSTKIEALREKVVEKHPNEKIVVFSRLASYIQPVLELQFQKWGVPYVVYRGSDKQRQEAKEQFRNDPEIRIFLSSDAGSDSIDLPEASVVINYDLPLKWSTLTQRRNRVHRVNSKHESVTFYTFLMANSVEDRIMEIIEKKYGYHRAIFKGEIADEAISARMTADDLTYILTGEEPG